MAFRKDEIVFLLGAGASVDAGIPESSGMIHSLEALLATKNDWKPYAPIYNYLKSSIRYAEGIKGQFLAQTDNIERLVNTLDDLRKGDEHPLYPFIGAWNPRLTELTNSNPEILENFRKMILRQLRDAWIQLEYDARADYYTGLSRFAKEYQYPLRVFSLNYDLCVEKACRDIGLELGFNEYRQWDWRKFDDEPESDKAIILQKLHGSIDWTRDTAGRVVFMDSPSRIEPENLAIIFGTTYKLQYVDPFLFFAYELRRRTLSDARLIVAIGYGFADEHINVILGQALKSDSTKRLLAIVGPVSDLELRRKEILKRLELEEAGGVECWDLRAKEFFDSHLTIERLSSVFPVDKDPFADITSKS